MLYLWYALSLSYLFIKSNRRNIIIITAVIPCLDESLLCHSDGLCGFDRATNRFQCSCKPGFTGNGVICKGKFTLNFTRKYGSVIQATI